MPNFKFELNQEGVKELLQSSEMQQCLNTEAKKVLGRLPSGYGSTPGMTSQRAKVTVGTRSFKAAKDNLLNNTLLKAVGGGHVN